MARLVVTGLIVCVTAVFIWFGRYGGCVGAWLDRPRGPTGRRATIQGVEFVELRAACFPRRTSRALHSTMWERWSALDGRQVGSLVLQDHLPPHRLPYPSVARIDSNIWVATRELTEESASRIMGVAVQYPRFSRHPVRMTWQSVEKLRDRFRALSGLPVRVPTEDEWEYLASAGSEVDQPPAEQIGEFAWYGENSKEVAVIKFVPVLHDVGTKRPNAWGIYDCLGNAPEWVEGTYQPGYMCSQARIFEGVLRGGSFWQRADRLDPTLRFPSCQYEERGGVRLVFTAPAGWSPEN